MTPRRLWLNKIPTQCDVVLEFPGKLIFLRMFTVIIIKLNFFLQTVLLMKHCAGF